jgi:hypothetical protein
MGGRVSPERNSWGQMMQRCNNPKDPRWSSYGGRGITICERWRSFENFLADIGPRPPGSTLERNDNDGDYEPGNCRWATKKEQANNRRDTHYVDFDGERLPAAVAASRAGLNYNTLKTRLKRGWSDYDALFRPLTK